MNENDYRRWYVSGVNRAGAVITFTLNFAHHATEQEVTRKAFDSGCVRIEQITPALLLRTEAGGEA